jgi:hypothetical protein
MSGAQKLLLAALLELGDGWHLIRTVADMVGVGGKGSGIALKGLYVRGLADMVSQKERTGEGNRREMRRRYRITAEGKHALLKLKEQEDDDR